MTESPYIKWIVGSVLVIAIICVLTVVLSQVLPVGPDYGVYRELGTKWINGETRLYDENGRNFFNAPWTLLLIVPLSLLPEAIGVGLLATLSILCIIVAVRLFTADKVLLATILAFAFMPTIYMLFNGQLDAIPLLGLGLAYQGIQRKNPYLVGLGFGLMAVKPTNLVLVSGIFLIGIKNWNLKDIAKVWIIPLVLVVVSCFVFGFDWIGRYISNYQAFAPIDNGTTTLWKVLDQFNIPALPIIIIGIVWAGLLALHCWKNGLTLWVVASALAVNFIFTPYAWIYHYVALIPAVIYLLQRHTLLGLIAYALSWSAAVRLVTTGQVYGTGDIILPITIGLICVGLYFSDRNRNQSTTI